MALQARRTVEALTVGRWRPRACPNQGSGILNRLYSLRDQQLPCVFPPRGAPSEPVPDGPEGAAPRAVELVVDGRVDARAAGFRREPSIGEDRNERLVSIPRPGPAASCQPGEGGSRTTWSIDCIHCLAPATMTTSQLRRPSGWTSTTSTRTACSRERGVLRQIEVTEDVIDRRADDRGQDHGHWLAPQLAMTSRCTLTGSGPG